jgi:deoxyribodipyrimidine photolyase
MNIKKIVFIQKCFQTHNNPFLQTSTVPPQETLFVLLIPKESASCGKLRSTWMKENLGHFLQHLDMNYFHKKIYFYENINDENIFLTHYSDTLQEVECDIVSGTYEYKFRQSLNLWCKKNNIKIKTLNTYTLFEPHFYESLNSAKFPKNSAVLSFTAWKNSIHKKLSLDTQKFELKKTNFHSANITNAETINCAGLSAWNNYSKNNNEPISHYKQTRNELSYEAFNFSKMSLYLSTGFLSPKLVWNDLQEKIEIAQQEKNLNLEEGARWLQQEILWREYFNANLILLGDNFFGFKNTDLNFYQKQCITEFELWKLGAFGPNLIRAAMLELGTTGFLSNRMRQIVASHLIYETKIPWYLGAFWFESQLIDFDTASNYGNWRYIEGSKFDSRGGRKFNLQIQIQKYDPNSEYVNFWLKK